MKRRLALWLYDRAIALEPLILVAVQEIVEARIVATNAQCLADAQLAEYRQAAAVIAQHN